jgi:hypothetical protein
MRINLLPRVKIWDRAISYLPRIKAKDGAIFVYNLPCVDEYIAFDYKNFKLYAVGIFGSEYLILSTDGLAFVGAIDVAITFWFPSLSLSLRHGPRLALGWIRRDDGSYCLGMERGNYFVER